MNETAMKAAPFFVLRTPTLSRATTDLVSEAFDAGRLLACDVLQRAFVNEAIFFASDNIYDRVYNPQPGFEVSRKLELSVARYLYRMATRSTPFGLFGGVSLVRPGQGLNLQISYASHGRRQVRPDFTILAETALRMTNGRSSAALHQTEICLNPTAWKAPDGLRYFEVVRNAGVETTAPIRLSKVAMTPAIDAAFEILTPKAMPFTQLIEKLSRVFEADALLIEEFVIDLIGTQLLQASPQLPVTGSGQITTYALEVNRMMPELGAPLIDTIEGLSGVSGLSHENIEKYEAAIERLRLSGFNIKGRAKALQVDFFNTDTALQIPSEWLKELQDVLMETLPLIFERAVNPLTDFHDKFLRRFGDAEVPLLQAVDEDYGVRMGGFFSEASPLVEGLSHAAKPINTAVFPQIGNLDLPRLLSRALTDGERIIQLTEADLVSAAASPMPPYPISVVGTFRRPKASSGSSKFIFELRGAGGVNSAAAFFGRFCYGLPALEEELRAYIRNVDGDTSDTIVAEVVHSPEGRGVNVSLRPVLRAYEIALLGKSGAASERQIDVADLYLRSVNGRMEMFNRRLQKRVLPRISNALNYADNRYPYLYRFLYLLQHQQLPQMRHMWGGLTEKLPYLPGIRYKNIYLAMPLMRLAKADTERVATLGTEASREAIIAALSDFPIGDVLRVGDDPYIEIDLKRALDRALFVEECRRQSNLNIRDITELGTEVTTDDEGNSLAHEAVIPFLGMSPSSNYGPFRDEKSAHGRIMPGSDWLYVRLYASPSIADAIIAESLPRLRELARNGGCTKFFFIRYDEGGFHVRLRVQGTPEFLWGEFRLAMEAMLAPLCEDGSIYKMEYGTYQPENFRYGNIKTLQLCERIFDVDSAAAEGLIACIRRLPAGEDLRWRAALLAMADLLNAFELEEAENLALIDEMVAGYSQELKVSGLNDRYRELRSTFDSLAAARGQLDVGMQEILSSRLGAVKPFARAIVALLDRHTLKETLKPLLHMTANRMFVSNGILHELVIFHCLSKSIHSKTGREKFEEKQRRNRALSYSTD